RSTALPTTPCAIASRSIEGNKETTAIRMHLPLIDRLFPIHHNPPRLKVYATQVLRHGRHPVFPAPAHDHERVRRDLHEMRDHAESLARQIHDLAAEQIAPVDRK